MARKKVKDNVDGQKKPLFVPPSRDMPVTIETVRNPEILAEIKDYATQGYTQRQIASALMVTEATLYNWSKRFPEVREVILEGNKVADDRVEYSLYEMCFSHEEREVTIEKDEDGRVVKQIVRTKHIPANVTAIQYWLQNRRRDTWKNHTALEFSGNTSIPVSIVYDLDTKKEPSLDDTK